MRIRKLTALMIAAALMIPAFSSCGSSAKVTAPALMSKVTEYDMDFSTEDWYMKSVTEYEYENAYPVSIKSYDYDSEMETETRFEYKFKEGLPSEATRYNDEKEKDISILYDRNGRRDRDYYYAGNSTTERVYQYGNRDAYFTIVHHETLSVDPEDPKAPKEHAEEIDSVIVSSENGLLVKTVNDGLFANWGDLEEKQWIRFMGSYTMDYDANGLVQTASAVYPDGPGTGDQDHYTITITDGRVTEAVVSQPFADDSGEQYWQDMVKYVFEYNDTEISADRYASMINDIVASGGGNYYIYNWY